MILALDIGNTHTTVGLFRGDRLILRRTIVNDRMRAGQILIAELKAILKRQNRQVKIDGSVITSVVPRLTRSYSQIVKQLTRTSPCIISASLRTGVGISYSPLNSLGTDRICGAAAAFDRFGGPVIIVDLGTATTFDVVSKRGEYLGGAIAPGIGTAAGALHSRTAQLPRIELNFPAKVMAKTTLIGMQSGIMFGALDGMEGMVRRIRSLTGASTKVVLTGGLAQIISRRTSLRHTLVPSLVLEGALLIYKLNAGQR